MADEQNPQSIAQRLGPRGISAIVLAILMIIFVAENTRHAKIRFIVGPEVSTPVWLALVIATAVGAAAGFLFQLHRARR